MTTNPGHSSVTRLYGYLVRPHASTVDQVSQQRARGRSPLGPRAATSGLGETQHAITFTINIFVSIANKYVCIIYVRIISIRICTSCLVGFVNIVFLYLIYRTIIDYDIIRGREGGTPTTGQIISKTIHNQFSCV